MTRPFFLPILYLVMITATFNTAAQPQPVLSCVSVSQSASPEVDVSWQIPAGTFDGFTLSYGPEGGPFTEINYPNTTTLVTINVPDVTTIIYEFFLRTFINSPSSVSQESNHLQTILLTITGDGTGIAKLEWNHQGGNDLGYRVLRSVDNINFQELVSTTDLKYSDTISNICDPVPLYYKIEHGTCNAQSNSVNALLEDQTPPGDPKLYLVTIENGFARLMWEPSPSADVDSIIIERKIGAVWYEYHVIPLSAGFIDDLTGDPAYLSACDESVSYVVRAKDKCGLESSGAENYQNPHNTILLTGNTSELCDRKATLYWNAYNNMVPPVKNYRVERSIAGGSFTEIAEIPSSGSTFQFIDPELLDPGIEVKYRIAAVNEDNSLVSHSCELSLIPNPRLITNFETHSVTVTNNEFITINVTSDPPDVPVITEIYRSSGDSMKLIATIPWDDAGAVTFDDHDVVVGQLSYLYLVKALDFCGNPIAESQEFNSILLQIGVSNENEVSLIWNDLIGWGSELKEYLIYKYNDGILVSGYPKVVGTGSASYNETDESGALRTTYLVVATKNDGTTVRSNEVLLPRAAKIDVPTAFRPSGYNSVFRPIMKNVDPDSYLLTIYNTWGQMVFETNDIMQGWNGEINGNIQQGVYIYMISYKDQAGSNGVKRGSVVLLD
ncbi:MAG TPA: gliding motility-associated C-terminal domain-containing protein [Lentimicrobium sp.]|nr:gliding motility-associated C-terminal domain-containing protein [Lentimicrobium sp.]